MAEMYPWTSESKGHHALPLNALLLSYYPLGYPMPYASDVYAERSFSQGLFWPEYLNMDKVFSLSVAKKKRQNRDKTEKDRKQNKTWIKNCS